MWQKHFGVFFGSQCRYVCVCVFSGLHCNAVWPCLRGRVYNGLQLPTVRRPSIRHCTQQLRRQTGVRVTIQSIPLFTSTTHTCIVISVDCDCSLVTKWPSTWKTWISRGILKWSGNKSAGMCCWLWCVQLAVNGVSTVHCDSLSNIAVML